MSARPRRRRAARVGLAVVIIIGVAVLVTLRRERSSQNLLIVTLDTTRADRLSPYGFMDVSLPHLERLAREGVVFDQATSVAPLTLPAHTTIFTGLLPPHHGVRDNADQPLRESQTTLAEILATQGFRTAGFVGSVVLDADRGLGQGFEVYGGVGGNAGLGSDGSQRRADAVVGAAIGWLDTIGRSRFFLWVHLYDPHRPYDPPEPYRSRYGHNLYLGEIAFADSQIGRLLDNLTERGLLDRTMVVVAGDHGESLGAHGERDHGIFVYEDVLRVPLIVRAPGLASRRVSEIVRLTDIMPTVLEALDVPAPSSDGTSLMEVMRGRRHDLGLEAYSESRYPERLGWSPLFALRSGRLKVIDAPRPELYDLEDDPFEERNVYDERRAEAEPLAARLADLVASGQRAGASDPHVEVTPALRARLGALGYVSAAVRRTPVRGKRPDPKDCMARLEAAADRAPSDLDCGPWHPPDDDGDFARESPPR